MSKPYDLSLRAAWVLVVAGLALTVVGWCVGTGLILLGAAFIFAAILVLL